MAMPHLTNVYTPIVYQHVVTHCNTLHYAYMYMSTKCRQKVHAYKSLALCAEKISISGTSARHVKEFLRSSPTGKAKGLSEPPSNDSQCSPQDLLAEWVTLPYSKQLSF